MSNDNLPQPMKLHFERPIGPGNKSVACVLEYYTADQVRQCQRDAVAASGAGVPDVIREAVEAAFEGRAGWMRKIAAAVRALSAAPTPDRAPHASTAGQEAVAVICDTWELRWIGSGPIAPIVHKHGLKIGDKLYANPAASEAPDLSARDAALEEAAVEVEEKKMGDPTYFEINEYLQEAADAIRALKSAPAIAPAGEAVTDLAIVPMHEQNARWAIDGAMAFGAQGINKPPSDDHWLMEYWKIGADAARLDFIEAHPERYVRFHKKHWSFMPLTNYEYDVFKTVREAIDAAIQAQAGDALGCDHG